MKECIDIGEHEGLPHLCFKIIHFPGHGDQNILVKQKRSKSEVLNMVPHYFLGAFQKPQSTKGQEGAHSTSHEGNL